MELTQSQANAFVRMQKAWRAIRAQRGSAAMNAVWKGDKAPREGDGGTAERIPCTDPRFLDDTAAEAATTGLRHRRVM